MSSFQLFITTSILSMRHSRDEEKGSSYRRASAASIDCDQYKSKSFILDEI